MIMWLLYHIVILCIQTLLSSIELTPLISVNHIKPIPVPYLILVKIVQEHKKYIVPSKFIEYLNKHKIKAV